MSSSPCRRVGAFFANRIVALVTCVTLLAGSASAQSDARPLSPTSPEATRASLTRMLDSLVADSAKVPAARRRARGDELKALRERLKDGDFQVGDRFLLDNGVQRDTVQVRDSVTVALLTWPSYSLRGVLRSELQGAMEKYVATYVREPRIRVFPLTRLGFTGGFSRSAYLSVDPTRPLSDALLAVGGVAPGAKADKIEIYRGDKRILDEKRVQQALRDGETIDDLRLRPGDELRVPTPKVSMWRLSPVQIAFFGVSALATILALIRASYNP
jgi:hypothetical protein